MGGGTRKTLLQIVKSVLLPKLFFGIGYTNSGSVTNMKSLKPLYNTGIRESSGVFRSSPVDSIMAESGQLPFDHVMVQSVVIKAIRLSEKVSMLYNTTDQSFPSIERARNTFLKLTNQSIPYIASLLRVGDRKWNAPLLHIDWDIKQKYKVGDSAVKAQQLFRSLCATKYVFHRHIFTDGSVNSEKVGFGVAYENIGHSKMLPKMCSVFSAEAMAILHAIKFFCQNTEASVIFTDSASVLSALEKGKSAHAWIQAIEIAMENKPIVLCWIPGHVGIIGNEKADTLAKAADQPEYCEDIPSEDVIRYCKQELRDNWEKQWRASTTFLRRIKCTSLAWPDRHPATERRAISRLRIGHTRLTHQHLFNRESGNCTTCGEPLTVTHLLVDCRAYAAERTQLNLKSTIGDILCNRKEEETRLVKFLRATKLIEHI